MTPAEFLDLYEAEQLRLLRLDPRERAMQAAYSNAMTMLYGMRKMLAALDQAPADHFSHTDKMVAPPIPEDLLQRVQAALRRFLDDRAPRSIPAEPTDADLVMHEVEMLIKGEYKRPFWLKAAPVDKDQP